MKCDYSDMAIPKAAEAAT